MMLDLQKHNMNIITIGLITFVAGVIIFYQLINDSETWEYNEDNPHKGTIISITTGAIITYLSFFYMDGLGSTDINSSSLFISVTVANTLSFIVDEIFTTKEGYNIYRKHGLVPAARRAISKVKTSAFFRHFFVTLLDIFIIHVMSTKVNEIIFKSVQTPAPITIFSQKIDIVNVVQRLIVNLLIISLYVIYGSRLRLDWAHNVNKNESFLITLSIIITSILFITNNSNNNSGLNNPNIKLLIVGVTYAMLVYGTIDDLINSDYEKDMNESNLWVSIVIISCIITFATLAVAQTSSRPSVLTVTSLLFSLSLIAPIISSMYDEKMTYILSVVIIAIAPIAYLIIKPKLNITNK